MMLEPQAGGLGLPSPSRCSCSTYFMQAPKAVSIDVKSWLAAASDAVCMKLDPFTFVNMGLDDLIAMPFPFGPI